MTTARTLIQDAYVSSGIKSPNEAVTAGDYQRGLKMLRLMVGQWATKSQLSSVVSDISATVGPGTSFTVQTGGDFNVVTPSAIQYAYARIGPTDYGMDVLSVDQYQSLTDKQTASSPPDGAYFDPAGRVYFYPPLSGAIEIHIGVFRKLSFADLDTDVPLQEGDELAIQLSLAEMLCIGLRAVDGELRRAAFAARASMKVKNTRVGQLKMGQLGEFDIITGTYR